MNARIFQLLQNPELIEQNDLEIIQKKIAQYPYMQSLRALNLLGVSNFDSENYPEELSITAAYTTDKKILYNLINKKKYEALAPIKISDIVEDKPEINAVPIAETLILEVAEKITEKVTEEEILDEIKAKTFVEEKNENKTEAIPTNENNWKPLGFSDFSVVVPEKEEVLENDKEEIISQKIEVDNSHWKPLQIAQNHNVESDLQELIIPEFVEEELIETNERPVLNVSFFDSKIDKTNKEESQEKTEIEISEKKEEIDSNVNSFVNTWENWLKIDRSSEEKKSKIIDDFIKTNPKISQLKDEVAFVVKEKSNDISHLMTETLAELYWEQRLYSQAIKAYKVLTEKHPEKKSVFDKKIQEIKNQKFGK